MTVPLGLAILPIYMRLWTSEGREKTTEFLHISLDFYLMAAACIYMLVTLGSHDALLLLASPKYLGADKLIPYLVGGLLIYTTHVFLCAGLLIQKKTGTMALALICSTILNVVLNCVLLPRMGLHGAAVALLLTHIVSILLLWLASSRIPADRDTVERTAQIWSRRSGGMGGWIADFAFVAFPKRRRAMQRRPGGLRSCALPARSAGSSAPDLSAAGPTKSARGCRRGGGTGFERNRRRRSRGLQMNPRVSVIIPAYNAAVYLPYAIESVIAQTYDAWEIVLVDDGSTDGTLAVADGYRERLGDRLQYIHQENRGLPAARNTGIRAARGEYIALLDADDVWLPQRLERGVPALDADAQAGLVHARVMRINAEGALIGQLAVDPKTMSGWIARNIYTRRAHIVCPTVMFRRICLEKAGCFDESLRATEDRDLWFRIAQYYKIVFLDEVLAYYRLSPNSMTSDMERLVRAQRVFVAKHRRSGAASRLDEMQALGNIYRELGDSQFRGGAVKKSLGNYLRSVVYNPLNIPNVYMLVRAIMDPVVKLCLPSTRLSNASL